MALSADQLNTIYNNVLFRNVDTGGIQFFANRTDISDAQVRQQIELSTEATTFVTPIVRLYQEVLGRVPDTAGLKFFSGQLRNGSSLDSITQQFLNSSEFTAKTTATSGAVDATDLSNTNQLVTDAFQSILGRAPQSSEFAYFSGRSPANILSMVASSNEAAQVNASNVTTFLDSAAQGSPNGGTLGNQTGAGGTTGGGTVFTLTTGADAITGTAGNDVINALSQATAPAATDTLTAADTINGNAGFDVLNITTTATNAAPTHGAAISGIEAVQIRATAGTATLAANAVPGATFLNSLVSAGNVVFTGAAAGTVFGDVGDGATTLGNLTGGYVDAATAAAVTLANGTKGGTVDVSGGAGLTSLTINSTGAANAITGLTSSGGTKTVTINATTNLDLGTGVSATAANAAETITGTATSVKLGAVGANVGSIDASGLSAGGVTAAINAGVASTFTFKGGQAADTVSVGGNFANAVAAGAINAGAGTDVINLTGQVTGAATGAAFTGFETLRNAAAAQQDASLFGSAITAVQTNASGAGYSNLTAAQAANIQVLATDANATFALTNATGTTDVLGLTLQNDATVNTGTTSATVINATGLTVTGFETLNVAVASGVSSIFSTGTTLQNPANIDNVSFTAAANLKAIAITGAFAAEVDASNATALTSIDASGNTAGVILSTGTVAGKLAITGTASADLVTIGAPAGTGSIGAISLGAGNDTIQIAQSSISAGTTIDGGAGTDTLELTDTGAVTIADASFRGVTNVEKILLDATTLTSFTVGGFANSLATSNGGTLDVTDISLTGGSTIDASGLTGTNKLVLNITDTGAAVSDAITTSTGGADSITIKGAHGTGGITITGGANTAGVTIDTSGVTTATGTNTITTGSGSDTIKVGTFAATIVTGAGNDTVTLTTGDAFTQTLNLTASGTSTTTTPTSVTGFNIAANNDVLKFVSANVETSANLGNGFTVTNGVATKSGATLSDFTAAIAASTTAGSAAFVVGTDTYVGYADGNSSTTGNDHIVKLVGVTATALGTAAAAGTVVVSA